MIELERLQSSESLFEPARVQEEVVLLKDERRRLPFWKNPLLSLVVNFILAIVVVILAVLLVVQSRQVSEDSTITTTTTSLCSPNYQYSNRTGFCYRANPVIVTIDDATAACQADGAHLASIHSKEENDVVSNFYYASLVHYQNTFDISLPTASVWIGLVYDKQLKNLTWSDGTVFDFSYWLGVKLPCIEAECSHAWITHSRFYDDGKHWYDIVAGAQKVAYVCKKAALKN